MSETAPLCKPIDPFARHDTLYRKSYPEEKYDLILHYLNIPSDIPFIYKWVSPQLAKELLKEDNPQSKLITTYKESLESDSCQSFVIRVEKSRRMSLIAQIDIEALYGRNLLEQWKALPGDYQVRILFSPTLNRYRNGMLNLMRLFLEFAFQFPEVKRIVLRIDEEYQTVLGLLIVAGFDRLDKVQLPEYRLNVFVCTRETLRSRGISIPGIRHEQ